MSQACEHILYPSCGCSPIYRAAPPLTMVVPTPHHDGWASAISGIGTDERDKRQSHRFRAPPVMTYEEVAALWEKDDIAAKAIEEPPAACFSEGYEITIGDEGSYDDLKEQIEDRLAELEVDDALEQAMQYERAYGGAAILLGTSDSRRFEDPLDVNAANSLDWLTVLEPIEVVPASTYDDPSAPKYGKPEFFQINNFGPVGTMHGAPSKRRKKTGLKPNSTTLIHESRLITFGGIKVSRYLRSSNPISPFWGASMVHRFIEALRDFGISYAGAGIIATDVAQPVISIEGLKDMVARDEKKLRGRMSALELGRSVARAILLDAKSEKFERQTTNLAGIPELIDRLSLRLSAAIGMPLSVLLGYSPATLGTPGQSELDQWHGKIRSTQRRRLTPIMRRLVMMIIRSLRQRKIPKKWGIRWNELKRLTDEERANARLTQARTDSMYIKAGVATPDEIRRSRFVGEYSYETQVEESKKAPGFMAPLPAGVMPGSTPAAGAKPGAPAAMGPNAHTVGGYARRNPTAPALGANPKQGGDEAPSVNRDAAEYDDVDITIALEELQYQRARRAELLASGRLTLGLTSALEYAEKMVIAELGIMGVRVDYDGSGIMRKFAGFDVVVESPRGSVREWIDSDGTAGKTRMKYDYGYFVGSRGTDGDSIDVYLGPSESAEWVYVIHQRKKSSDFKEYDEDKVMLGFDSPNHARDAYLRQYDDERFFGGMSQMRVEDFRPKLKELLGAMIAHGDADEVDANASEDLGG